MVMVQSARRAALILLLALAPAAAIQAEGVLDHVPQEAMGFAVVRNLAATNEKIVRLMDIFKGLSEAAPPAPLTLVKAATGIGDGLNEGGDALVALLAGANGAADPRPMMLIPISDYAKFAASVSGDATGAVCRVTIAGEEVLLGKKGDYALLMNVENRPTMEAVLNVSPEATAESKLLADWVVTTDLAIVVLPAGIDALATMGQAEIEKQQAAMAENDGADLPAELAQVKAGLEMYKNVLGFCGAEIAAGGFGLTIDDATNLRFTDRLVFEKDGKVAQMAPMPKPAASPLAGYPAAPFVSAGGGPLPKGWYASLAKMSRNMMEANPGLYGFEKFDAAEWDKLEESWRAGFDASGISMAMLVGEPKDPLYSNIYFVAEVADAGSYLQSMRKSMELWNELTKKSSSDIKLAYEFSELEVAGKPAMLMSMDIGAAAADENVPMVKPLMEAMFGADGKMRFYVIAADADTVVMAIAPEDRAAKAVEAVLAGETGLAQSADVQATAALMNPDAPWTGFVSPPGFAAWVSRLMTTVMAQFGAPAPAIPEYPASPPIGFSMNLADGQFQGEMVVPVQVLSDLAAFIKKAQGM
jgi:hypothetical protein